MIGFMPEPYPDELVYSVLSRYHSQSGHLVFRASAEALFTDPLARPDVAFVNRYTEELLGVLGIYKATIIFNTNTDLSQRASLGFIKRKRVDFF